MKAPLRKFLLLLHIISSLAWFGTVVAFIILALVGLNSADAELVRAVYLAGNLIAWVLIVPLAFASLLTGLAQALFTKWGLFRHYWIVFKLLINLLASVLLLLHTQPIAILAQTAAKSSLPANMLSLQTQLVFDASAALLALLLATILSVYKPRGLTPYGWHKQQNERQSQARLRA